jgi:choline kinase
MLPGRKKFGADLSIIIPAAGDGKRMRSYGPKSLLNVGNEDIINRQIRILREQYPKSEIIIVVGFQSDQVIKKLPKGIKIVENELYNDTTPIRSIQMGLRVSTHENILILNSDLIFNHEALYSITSDNSCAIIDSMDRIKSEEIGVIIIDGKVSHFGYGLKPKWAQIIFINGNELSLFKKNIEENSKKNIYIFEVLNKVIEQGGIIKHLEPKGMKIIEIDSSKDITIAKKYLGFKHENIMYKK